MLVRQRLLYFVLIVCLVFAGMGGAPSAASHPAAAPPPQGSPPGGTTFTPAAGLAPLPTLKADGVPRISFDQTVSRMDRLAPILYDCRTNWIAASSTWTRSAPGWAMIRGKSATSSGRRLLSSSIPVCCAANSAR